VKDIEATTQVGGEMSRRHAGWQDRVDREYLLSAGHARLRHDRRPLARLLAAACARARPNELAGEQASVAAFLAMVRWLNAPGGPAPGTLSGSAGSAGGAGRHG
jgi:hypothetical protein